MKRDKLRLRYIGVDAVTDGLDGCYDQEKLAELADSVRAFGVVQPLLVVRRPLGGYDLLSGGRRLAAARLVHLKKIPALVMGGRLSTRIAAALLCDLHRETVSEFRTAQLLERLCQSEGMDTASLSNAVGLSEEQLASYKKLLSLSPEQQQLCAAAQCGKDYSDRIAALPASEKNKLFFGLFNEAHPLEERAQTLRERLGCRGSAIPRRTVAIKDVRIFFNTIDRAVDVMQRSGVKAASERHDYEDFTEYLIRIPLDTGSRRA